METLIDRFKDTYFSYFPERATFLGEHKYDSLLGLWDKDGVKEKLNFLNHYRDLVKNNMETGAQILKNICESHIFHIKKVKPYLRPDFFVSYALQSIDRNIFLLNATNDKKLQDDLANSLVARVSLFPILFEHSRQWLKQSDPISMGLALYEVTYFRQFLETSYRQFIYRLDIGPSSKEKLMGVIPFTLENLNRFEAFLHTLEQVPLESGIFRRSKNFYQSLFKHKYMIDCSPSTLVKRTTTEIERLTADLNDIACGDVIGYHENLIKENAFPYSGNTTNEKLLGYFMKQTQEYVDACMDTGHFPAISVPKIDWTPSYKQKSSPLAAYIDRGPYERILDGGIFWVTPVPEQISRKQYEGLTSLYHRQFMNSITIHEVIGHHLASENLEKNLDTAFAFSSNLTYDEGFALYVEEEFTRFYVDYAKISDHEKNQMLFFQKKAALLRAYRVIVDIGLGTGEMDIDEASKLYADKNNFPITTARNECEKYYLNPGTASSYFIGKLEISNIRNLLETKLDKDFSLPRFHKLLVSFGSIPIAMIRRRIIEEVLRE